MQRGKNHERQAEADELAAALAERGIRSAAVLRAIRSVPRHRFVPDSAQGAAYEDRALPIGHGQTISQPYIVAYMTELLEVEAGMSVLEVGTGSGYQAAVLAQLTGQVYSVEILAPVAAHARAVLEALGYESVHLRVGDGYDGWAQHAPFDRIIVTAAAPRVPDSLVGQLAAGGRLVIPIGPELGPSQWIWLVAKDDGGNVTSERTLPVRFVPMTGEVENE